MEREKLFEVDPYGLAASTNTTSSNTNSTNSTSKTMTSNVTSKSGSNDNSVIRDHSLISSSDSLPTTSQASYSVPGSRRNSTDGEDTSFVDAFDCKLKLQDNVGFLTPHRSMSIDEAAMKQKLAIGPMAAEKADRHGTQRLLFDHDADTPRVTQGYPYLQRYTGSTDTLSSLVHNDAASTPSYNGLFSPGSNDLDMVSSLRKNSTRQNKSVESLRSKSWAQCLESTSSPLANSRDRMLPSSRAQAALFEQQQRRFSYGWPPSSSSSSCSSNINSNANIPASPSAMDAISYEYFAKDKNRLTTSHSYSDLHAAARSYTTQQPHPHHHHQHHHHQQQQQHQHHQHHPHNHRYSPYDISTDTKDMIPCPQYIQYGMCPLDDQCPYSHSPLSSTMNFHPSISPSPHPLATCQQYPLSAQQQSPQQQQQQLQLQQQPGSLTHPTAHSLLGFSSSSFPSYDPNSSFFPSSKLTPRYGSLTSSNNNSGNNNNNNNGHFGGNTNGINGNHQNSIDYGDAAFMEKGDALMLAMSDMSQQQRRSIADPEANRFLGAKLEDYCGKLYELCKDHNGCRFLQKKLEDPNGQHLQTIFDEIHPHFVELMTDPFGNYLCQKLVERCNDVQRTAIVDIISPDLLQICLSMHGTRAIQKLIEYLSSNHQIKTVTAALQPKVVTLIKDLNGNHVIQKCLHRLSAEHNQFIYDIVSENCIEVATHRHGCCVLQRCIDHAVDVQKSQLVQVVTRNVLPLVQDPFGNYVVQYVLDLGEVQYSDALVRCLIEHVCDLSVQKFSSNVIEKCIRVSEPEIRRALIAELINQSNMEKLLRDSFANYVIQTCLDYADQDQKVQLVERIRPHLASIRSTPYGKRIHSKVQREQQQNRYVQRQQLHYPSMPSLRSTINGGTGTTSNGNGFSGVSYQDDPTMTAMAGLPLNYNMGILGNAHPLYPFP